MAIADYTHYCILALSFSFGFCVPSLSNCNLSTVLSYRSDLKGIALFFQGRQFLNCKYACVAVSLNTVAMNTVGIVVLHVTGSVYE